MLAAQSAAAAGSISGAEQKAIAQAIEAGLALHQRGLLDDAERLYSGILKLAPRHFDAMHLLGVLHHQRGDSHKALKLIGAALELNAASADAFANHAKVLMQLRRYDEALVSIERLLALAPDQHQALINRATIRIEQCRFADAVADATRVLKADPNSLDGWTKRGNALAALGESAQALASFDRALAINPDHVEALNNRGCLLGDVGRTEEGLATYDRLLKLAPGQLQAWINRGHMLTELHREEEGLASYEQALALEPHSPVAMFNLGMSQLRLGQFKLGWENYEQRWSNPGFEHTRRKYSLPRWSGEAVNGPLLLTGEQGLGEQIMHASMLADVMARTPQVIAEVEPRLVPLIARSFPGVNVVTREEGRLYDGPAVAQIDMGSLGRLFRPDWASFPNVPDGYLRGDPELSSRLRARLSDGRTVIGLSWWSRNPRYEMSKSARLQDFANILRKSNCRCIDLQYGDTRAEREAIQHDLGVTLERLPDVDNSGDIDALASLIMACDIVVTVSNTTAHLAGALGKETYVLVPSGRGRMWCWFRGRNDSPFYARARLKRQRPGQPWSELADDVATEIAG
jgi:tetratricopeptide (TPR) repeat protein